MFDLGFALPFLWLQIYIRRGYAGSERKSVKSFGLRSIIHLSVVRLVICLSICFWYIFSVDNRIVRRWITCRAKLLTVLGARSVSRGWSVQFIFVHLHEFPTTKATWAGQFPILGHIGSLDRDVRFAWELLLECSSRWVRVLFSFGLVDLCWF